MSTEEEKKPSGNADRVMGGSIVLGIGLMFLLVNLRVLPRIQDSWPVMLIIVGAAIIIGSVFKKRD